MMNILYKISGFIISLIGFFIAISLVIIIPVFITAPVLWLPMFMIIAVILYTWFANRFRQKVVSRHEVVKRSLRDLIKVNGYVAIVFSVLNVGPIISLIRDPATYIAAIKEFSKQFGQGNEQSLKFENIQLLMVITLVYLIALFFHVLFTFALVKKHEEYFQ